MVRFFVQSWKNIRKCTEYSSMPLPSRRESKATCIVFGEDADACKRTKNAIKRLCLSTCYLRQFFSGFCSMLEQISKTQPRSDRNRLCSHKSKDHLHQLCRW